MAGGTVNVERVRWGLRQAVVAGLILWLATVLAWAAGVYAILESHEEQQRRSHIELCENANELRREFNADRGQRVRIVDCHEEIR